jgi:chromosome segregation ATPase
MSEQDTFDKLISGLKEQRDELRVQLHLAKAEVKDEWDEVEQKWEHIEPKLEKLGHEAKESAEDLGAALSRVAEEIGHAYQRIRNALR